MQWNGNANGRVSGHLARVERKRGPVWYARGRYADGRPWQRCLGPAWQGRGRPPEGYYTRRTAEAALAAYLTDIRRGQVAHAVKTGVTFGEACEAWLRWVADDRKRRRSTVLDYRRAVAHRLLPEFGADTPLGKITTERIEAWRAQLVASGEVSDRTVNKLRTILSGVFRYAQRRYGLPGNPVAGVDAQPERSSGDMLVLTPDEVRLLAEAAEDPQDAALYTVAAFTGLRLGELLALRWGDVDFGNRLVHVRRSYTYGAEGVPKSGKVRAVPLCDPAAAALDGLSRRPYHVGEDDLVFCTPVGGHLDHTRLRRRFWAARDRAGLKPIRFHDLRHTYGTLAVRVYPLTDVRAYMGHSDITTTMRYVHYVPQHDAADKLTALVAAAEPASTLAVS
jgi:integrase